MRYLFIISWLFYTSYVEASDKQQHIFTIYEIAQLKQVTISSCNQLKASKLREHQPICFHIKGEGTFSSIHSFLEVLWGRGFILGKKLNMAVKKDNSLSFSVELLLCAHDDRSVRGCIDRAVPTNIHGDNRGSVPKCT